MTGRLVFLWLIGYKRDYIIRRATLALRQDLFRTVISGVTGGAPQGTASVWTQVALVQAHAQSLGAPPGLLQTPAALLGLLNRQEGLGLPLLDEVPGLDSVLQSAGAVECSSPRGSAGAL